MPTLRVFLGGSWREEEDDDEFEQKSIGVFCLLLFCSFAYPESPRIMTLRRVLRLPADTISCAFVGEREAAAEREREKEKGRDKRPSRCKRERERERERESTGASSSVLFPLSSFSSRSLLSKKNNSTESLRQVLFFISLVLVSLSTCSLSLSLSTQSLVVDRASGLRPPCTAAHTLAMSAAAAMGPSSRDGDGGVDAAATTPAAAIARPGSAATDDARESSGRKEGSGRATQKRAFDLVLR